MIKVAIALMTMCAIMLGAIVLGCLQRIYDDKHLGEWIAIDVWSTDENTTKLCRIYECSKCREKVPFPKDRCPKCKIEIRKEY